MSSFLLVIPWLGYRYILEMESFLQRGQEQVILGTAQALATALSERPELFSDSSYSRSDRYDTDLYVYPVFYPLAIEDGTLQDWRDYQFFERDYREIPAEITGKRRPGDELSFQLMLAEHERSLFAYLKVQDENLVLRDRAGIRVDRSDSLRLSLMTRDGVFERYVVAPYEDEYIYPYRIGTEIRDVSSLEYEPRITGRWNQTEEGYEIELRLPLELVGEQLGFGIIDVDNVLSREIESYVFTSNNDNPLELGSLQRPTREIDRVVAGMGRTNSHIQVIDANQRMLLSIGDIQTAGGLMLSQDEEPASGVWGWLETHLLHPLYYQVLSKPTTDFLDELYLAGAIEGEHLSSALNGRAASGFREVQGEDEAGRVLGAAYPIVANRQVLGAVLVDQNMNGIRTFRNQAMETLFNTMLAILTMAILALFLFASNLSSRLRGLRNQAEKIIDDSGRLANSFDPSRSSDEIGDLSRSFASIVDRLGQYTNYLENMSSRLSHELRTPVTVVRSSLENLGMLEGNNEEAAVYIRRAEEGIKRLNLILTNMSEAARLENILLDSDRELTDVGKVVSACMEGYKQIYPGQQFDVDVEESDTAMVVMGGADYLAQMLDKLITNAVDFALPDTAVRVDCYREESEVVLSVTNNGDYLSDEMKDRIFDSMVSVRPQHKQQEPHLGMGLHIVRMVTDYHKGYVFADNLIQEEGVMVTVRLPLEVAAE